MKIIDCPDSNESIALKIKNNMDEVIKLLNELQSRGGVFVNFEIVKTTSNKWKYKFKAYKEL
jgi:hypothetical protein